MGKHYPSELWDPAKDSNGFLQMNNGTQIAGEDLDNDLIHVEHQFSYSSLTSSTTIAIKTTAGVFHVLNVGMPSMPTITIYDNSTPNGTVIARLGVNPPIGSYIFDQNFSTGLTIDATAAGVTPWLNIGYR